MKMRVEATVPAAMNQRSSSTSAVLRYNVYRFRTTLLERVCVPRRIERRVSLSWRFSIVASFSKKCLRDCWVFGNVSIGTLYGALVCKLGRRLASSGTCRAQLILNTCFLVLAGSVPSCGEWSLWNIVALVRTSYVPPGSSATIYDEARFRFQTPFSFFFPSLYDRALTTSSDRSTRNSQLESLYRR
ncbi:hypothetical protein V1478_002688 [Vespula squamosa]|uniref:Uncharacterized protein n=1 Tax=Vespula squamosa TaxID=30214 RepID=A0ABD2BTS1_VESSQ